MQPVTIIVKMLDILTDNFKFNEQNYYFIYLFGILYLCRLLFSENIIILQKRKLIYNPQKKKFLIFYPYTLLRHYIL